MNDYIKHITSQNPDSKYQECFMWGSLLGFCIGTGFFFLFFGY